MSIFSASHPLTELALTRAPSNQLPHDVMYVVATANAHAGKCCGQQSYAAHIELVILVAGMRGGTSRGGWGRATKDALPLVRGYRALWR